MTDVDPRDPDLVGAAVAGWLAAHLGSRVRIAEPPVAVGEGFDSWIHLVRFAGDALPDALRAPLVARVLPDVDRYPQAQREATIQGWCADHGYPAPRILEVVPPGEALAQPVQLMERAPGVTMLAAVTAAPWRAAALIDRLGDLHARLHALDPADCPLIDHPDGSLVARRLALPRRVATWDADVAVALARVDALAPRLVSDDARVCHGDFHPLNVLVDGPASAVIDWSDAGIGDRHGDVARSALLFRVAAIAAGNRLERLGLRVAGPWMARRYLHAYGRHLPLDRSRLRLFEPMHLLHGWAQVVALHAGAFENVEPDDERGRRVPASLLGWLRQRFDRAMDDIERVG